MWSTSSQLITLSLLCTATLLHLLPMDMSRAPARSSTCPMIRLTQN